MRKFKIAPPVHDEFGISVPRGGVSLLHDKNGLLLNSDSNKSRKLPPKVIPIPNKIISVKAFDIKNSNIKMAKGAFKPPIFVGHADSLWNSDEVVEMNTKDNNNEVDIDRLQDSHEQAPSNKVHPFVVELAKLAGDIRLNIGKLPAENVEKLEEFLSKSAKSPINIIYNRLEASKDKNSIHLNEALNGLVEEISASIQNRKIELGMYTEDQEEEEEDNCGEEDDCGEENEYEEELTTNPERKELLESFYTSVANASGGPYFILKNGSLSNVVVSKEQLSRELSSYDSLDDVVVLKKINVSYGVIFDG